MLSRWLHKFLQSIASSGVNVSATRTFQLPTSSVIGASGAGWWLAGIPPGNSSRLRGFDIAWPWPWHNLEPASTLRRRPVLLNSVEGVV